MPVPRGHSAIRANSGHSALDFERQSPENKDGGVPGWRAPPNRDLGSTGGGVPALKR